MWRMVEQKWRGKGEREHSEKEKENNHVTENELITKDEEFVNLFPLPETVEDLLIEVKNGNQDVIQLASEWIKSNNDPAKTYSFNETQLSFLLALATKKGYLHIIDLIFSRLEVDVNKPWSDQKQTYLHIAALYGQTACVSYLLSIGASPGYDALNCRPLHLAVMGGFKETAFVFFNRDHTSIFKMQNDQESPLLTAYKSHKNVFYSFCQFILEKRSELIKKVFSEFARYKPPIEDLIDFIAKKMSVDIVQFLYEQGPLREFENISLINHASILYGRKDIQAFLEKKSLIYYSDKDNHIVNQAKRAAAAGQLTLLKWFLAKRSWGNSDTSVFPASLEPILNSGIQHGHLHIAQYLIECYYDNFKTEYYYDNFKTEYYYYGNFTLLLRCLNEALKSGHSNIADYFFNLMRDKCYLNNYYLSHGNFDELLILAIEKNQLAFFKRLFIVIFDIDNLDSIKEKNKIKKLLTDAVIKGRVDIVYYILGIKIFLKGNSFRKDELTFQEKNKLDSEGNTIAHYAAAHGQIEVLQKLQQFIVEHIKKNLDYKEMMTQENSKGDLPLVYAIKEKKLPEKTLLELIKFLDSIDCLPEFNKEYSNKIFNLCIRSNLYEVVDWCIEKGQNFRICCGSVESNLKPKPSSISFQMAIHLLPHLEPNVNVFFYYTKYIKEKIQTITEKEQRKEGEEVIKDFLKKYMKTSSLDKVNEHYRIYKDLDFQEALFFCIDNLLKKDKPIDEISREYNQCIKADLKNLNIDMKEALKNYLQNKMEEENVSFFIVNIFCQIYQDLNLHPEEALIYYLNVLTKKERYDDIFRIIIPILFNDNTHNQNLASTARMMIEHIFQGNFAYSEEDSPLESNDPYLTNYHQIVKRALYAYYYFFYFKLHIMTSPEDEAKKQTIHRILSDILDPSMINCSTATWNDRAKIYLCALLLHKEGKLGEIESQCIRAAFASLDKENPVFEEECWGEMKEWKEIIEWKEIREGEEIKKREEITESAYFSRVPVSSSHYWRLFQPHKSDSFSNNLIFSKASDEIFEEYQFVFSLDKERINIQFDVSDEKMADLPEALQMRILGELANHLQEAFEVNGEYLEVELGCNSITLSTDSTSLSNALAKKLEQNRFNQYLVPTNSLSNG